MTTSMELTVIRESEEDDDKTTADPLPCLLAAGLGTLIGGRGEEKEVETFSRKSV